MLDSCWRLSQLVALGSAILVMLVQQLMPESESPFNLSSCQLPSSQPLSRRGERTPEYTTGLEDVADVHSAWPS